MQQARVTLYDVSVKFSMPSEINFYLTALDNSKIDEVTRILNNISKKYDIDSDAKNAIVIYRRIKAEYPFRVAVLAIPKRIALDVRNLKDGIRAWLKGRAFVLPADAGNVNIYLIPREELPEFRRYIENRVKPAVEFINKKLDEYYNSEDYEMLISTIKSVADFFDENEETKRPIKYQPLVHEVVFDLSRNDDVREFMRNSLKDLVSKYYSEVVEHLRGDTISKSMLIEALQKANQKLIQANLPAVDVFAIIKEIEERKQMTKESVMSIIDTYLERII